MERDMLQTCVEIESRSVRFKAPPVVSSDVYITSRVKLADIKTRNDLERNLHSNTLTGIGRDFAGTGSNI